MNQLLLFEMEKDPDKEFEKMKGEWEKTRRSLYARNTELNKKVTEIGQELALLKMYICKGKIVL